MAAVYAGVGWKDAGLALKPDDTERGCLALQPGDIYLAPGRQGLLSNAVQGSSSSCSDAGGEMGLPPRSWLTKG